MAKVLGRTFNIGRARMACLNFTAAKGAWAEELREALGECDREIGLANVVRQAFFLSSDADRCAVAATLAQVYGGPMPPTTFAWQPPAFGESLAAELWAFPEGAAVRHGDLTTTASAGDVTWGFVGGLGTDEAGDPHDGVRSMLAGADDGLGIAGFQFRDIARTWYYIGSLLAPAGRSTRYDRFNQARNEFFQDIWRDLQYSPASTGIGMQTNRVVFEAVALRGPEASARVTWIDNPLQTKPFNYNIAVDQRRKPSFSRGAAVTFGKSMLVFVSGTASIRESQVVYPGDVEAQTRVTIENIATLIGKENLMGNHGLAGGARLEDIRQYRVYVKRPQDAAAVRTACESLLGDVPGAYLVADVCRPECLVEIEAVAACGE